jgi:hypothetical protein
MRWRLSVAPRTAEAHAENISVAPRTAEAHVENIRRKAGCALAGRDRGVRDRAAAALLGASVVRPMGLPGTAVPGRGNGEIAGSSPDSHPMLAAVSVEACHSLPSRPAHFLAAG